MANNQEFAELAHSALHAKAPTLMPFVSGFQTVKESDDGTRLIGLFGISIGKNLFFTPVFFLKGAVKPLELIFDYTRDRFIPFTKMGISQMMRSDDVELGESHEDPLAGFSDMRAPNTDAVSSVFTRSNSLHKMASLKPRPLHSYIPSFIEKSSSEVKKAFIDLLNNEAFAQEVHKNIGLGILKEAVAKNSKRIEDGVVGNSTATESGGVEIITVNPRANKKAILDKVPVEKLSKAMKKGYYVKDSRKKTSILYNTQYESSFSNPVSSGEFSTVLNDGALARVVILCKPHALYSNISSHRTLVLDPALRFYSLEDNHKITVSPVRESSGSRSTLLENSCSVKHMRLDRKYIITTPCLKKWAGPVSIRTSRYSPSGTTHYSVMLSGEGTCANLVAGLSNAESFKKVGNEVIIPGAAVAIDITDIPSTSLGSPGDLTHKLYHTGLEPVIITHDGVEYNVGDSQKLDRHAAMRKLILNLDLSEDDSEGLLSKAASDRSVHVLVKKANPVVINTLEGSDRPKSTIRNIDTPEQYPEYHAEAAYSYNDPYLDPVLPEPSLPALNLSASMTGDKAIFDGSVLLSLAEREDISEIAQEYIPDLEAAIDKIGRLLFLLWWQHDKFREKYSPAEVTTMESNFKQLLHKLGDLAYGLRNRAKAVGR